MTTTVEPQTAAPSPATPAAAHTPSRTEATSSRTSETRPTVQERLTFWLSAVGIPGALLIGAIGFGLSFHNLTAAGEKWGFGDNANWFAIGVDASIVTFLVIDLLLTLIGVRFGLLRLLAHLMTLATIVFNAAAFGSPLDHPVRSAAHGLMPVLFIVGVEAGRRVLLKHAALQKGKEYEPIGLNRWLLAPLSTWSTWRRMQIWDVPSYSKMLTMEQDRAVYRAWLDHRQEIEAGHKKGNVSALDRLPITMRRFGLTVDEALALPDKMRRDELRRTQEAERRALALTLEQEKATAEAEKQRLRMQADIAAVRAEVEAETTVAQARAESAGATARLEAATVLSAAERAAEETARRAAAEKTAEESAKIATERAKEQAALAKTAQESAKIAEANRLEAEAKRLTAEESAKEQAALAKVTEESAKAALAEQQIAEAEAKAAKARALTARANLAAIEAEDLAGLTQRPRKVRRAARMLLESAPEHETAMRTAEDVADYLRQNSPLTSQDIGAALGITSPGSLSEYRTEALALIARGYNHRTGYDPDRTTDQDN
ncbi:DUF2637 domain-containing protein [Streptomyces sp. NPDC001205]